VPDTVRAPSSPRAKDEGSDEKENPQRFDEREKKKKKQTNPQK